jgi:hypothetical protein
MRLILARQPSIDGATIGHLVVDGEWECFTIEDVVRPRGSAKIPGKTAIPAGLYELVVNISPRFSRRAGHDIWLPRLVDVPGFDGILIHPGNTAEDTEGCILPGLAVGRLYGMPAVLQSRVAFDALFAKIRRAEAAGERMEIEVRDAR